MEALQTHFIFAAEDNLQTLCHRGTGLYFYMDVHRAEGTAGAKGSMPSMGGHGDMLDVHGCRQSPDSLAQRNRGLFLSERRQSRRKLQYFLMMGSTSILGGPYKITNVAISH